VALYEKASGIARQIGWKLEEAAVGGGSDGNFTAALGIPTLDGLGGVGEGAHAAHEAIVISELPKRAALLSGLIETVSAVPHIASANDRDAYIQARDRAD